MLQILFMVFVFLKLTFCSEFCEQGGEIYERGINETTQEFILTQHNVYRAMIRAGEVPDQPRARRMFQMVYDELLAESARNVSDTCEFEHVYAKDPRWNWVGQNIYVQYNNKPKPNNQEWGKAMAAWFDEHSHFIYPDGKQNDDDVIAHYTQMVWNNTYTIGCDFIFFYDSTREELETKTVYARMYTCNYGPGGNYENEPPYETYDDEENSSTVKF